MTINKDNKSDKISSGKKIRNSIKYKSLKNSAECKKSI